MARIRTNKNICLNCFGDLDATRVCESCKKRSDDTPSPVHHIPQRTILRDKKGADRYLVGKSLGEGGFGITYLAWDLFDGSKVAIKEYFPNGYVTRVNKTNQVIINNKQMQAASNRGLRRFIEEARTLAGLRTLAGIVTVRDFFSANGTAYIVMEFLDGVSFKAYLKRRSGKIPIDEALKILRPVMEALVLVHQTGLIHRDISPDNIIITKTGQVKLIDFGAAKYSNVDGKSLSIVLKQGFAPEEQYRTHGEQGAWTDVYALGVTLYFAITGQLPPESIQRIYKDTLVRPSELGVEITPAQEAAILKALAVYAKNRYQDMAKFMDGLFGRGTGANLLKQNSAGGGDNTTIDSTKTIDKTDTAKRGRSLGKTVAATSAVSGKTKLADGKTKLADDKTRVADGKTKLADDKTKLADGKTKLADDKTKLADDKTKAVSPRSRKKKDEDVAVAPPIAEKKSIFKKIFKK